MLTIKKFFLNRNLDFVYSVIGVYEQRKIKSSVVMSDSINTLYSNIS